MKRKTVNASNSIKQNSVIANTQKIAHKNRVEHIIYTIDTPSGVSSIPTIGDI